MHPDIGEALARMGAAALRNLVFMVGELQVQAPAVNVKGGAQQIKAHRRAFDMPAGPAPAPWAVPARFIRVRGFPQDKIHRIALVGRNLDPGASDHVIDRAPRKLAIVGIAAHIEQHMPLCGIGMAPGDQPLDHRHHLHDIFRRAGFMRGRQGTQSPHIGVIPADGLIRQSADDGVQIAGIARFLHLPGAGVDLVIDIGEIAHIGDVIGAINMAQEPEQHVEHHHGPRIAQMRAVIDGGAADIHPHIRRIDGRKTLFAAGARIVQTKCGHRGPVLPLSPRSGEPGQGQAPRVTTLSAGNTAQRVESGASHALAPSTPARRMASRAQLAIDSSGNSAMRTQLRPLLLAS